MKRRRFYIPGIYHDLLVVIVSKRWLVSYTKEKDITGYYEPLKGKIYVVRDLAPQVQEHTLYHEISHHIVDTLEGVEDENKCDVLGAYLIKLSSVRSSIQSQLNEKDKSE